MEYVIITLLVIAITAFVFYKLANNVFGFPIKLKPLIMCAGCAVLLSLVVPRVVVSYAGFGGTLGVLVFIGIICAYFIAYYDKFIMKHEATNTSVLNEAYSINETSLSAGAEDDIAATKSSDIHQVSNKDISIHDNVSIMKPVSHAKVDEERRFIEAEQELINNDVQAEADENVCNIEITKDPVEEDQIAESEPGHLNDKAVIVETSSCVEKAKELVEEEQFIELDQELINNDVQAEADENVCNIEITKDPVEEDQIAESEPGHLNVKAVIVETSSCVEKAKELVEEEQFIELDQEFINNDVQAEADENVCNIEITKDPVEEDQIAESEPGHLNDKAVIVETSSCVEKAKELVEEEQFIELDQEFINNDIQAEADENVCDIEITKDPVEEDQIAESEAGHLNDEAVIVETSSCVEKAKELVKEEQFIELDQELINNDAEAETASDVEITEAPAEEDLFIEPEPEFIINDEDQDETIESASNIEIKAECGQNQNIYARQQCFVDLQQPDVAEEVIVVAENLLLENPSLDELMDHAFKQKESLKFDQAVVAFRKVLEIYPECDAAPYLLVEIGNLHKKAGKFDKAISTFDDGRRIAAAASNNVLEKEFIDAIAYLRILKNILIQNKMFCTRFDDIPVVVMEEINKEFSEWRNIS